MGCKYTHNYMDQLGEYSWMVNTYCMKSQDHLDAVIAQDTAFGKGSLA